MKKISVVVPVFNEQAGIVHFHETVCRELAEKISGAAYEIVYVNDGSCDGTADALAAIQQKDSGRVLVVNFLRNFGQVPALLAGLQYASGDCAAVISADLQDPPSMIPEMFKEWLAGNKLVLSVRKTRQDDFLSRAASKVFYSLMSRFANPHIPAGGFDYFLMDRALVDRVLQSDERNPFLQGLVLWPGFRPKYLFYERLKRETGESHWTLNKKIKYFIDGFAAYSLFPIRFISVAGLALFFGGLAGYGGVLISAAAKGAPEASDWLLPSLFALTGLLMICFGIIGEYVWRVLEQVRKRPLYIIDSVLRRDGGAL